MTAKKQLRINQLFRKGGGVTKVSTAKAEEDCDDLREEVQQLEKKLQEKQNELFQLQRNSYRQKAVLPKKKEEAFVMPKKIVLKNSVNSLQNSLHVMSMLTGIEVQSFVAGDHCSVVFHMQHDSQYEVKHGLRIEMRGGINEISACNMPLGFNMEGVMEDFDNIKRPECLGSIRKALVAYYDRLEQYHTLKRLVNVEAELFKTLDGSHIEIALHVQNENEDEDEREQHSIVLLLDYRVYDIRPKNYSIKEDELPEEVAAAVREQCAVFRKQPLRRAFKEAFVNGVGQYKIVRQMGVRPAQARPRKRPRPARADYNNDDTFHPEDVSEYYEDADELED